MNNTAVRFKGIAFDPEVSIGRGWKISEQDRLSLDVGSLDLAAISLQGVVRDGEERVGGFERIDRLKQIGRILLDARAFLVLWENKRLIPPRWEERIGGASPYIYFDGTIIRSPCGHRNTLCLYHQGGEWRCDHIWLALDLPANHVSAVLESAALSRAS